MNDQSLCKTRHDFDTDNDMSKNDIPTLVCVIVCLGIKYLKKSISAHQQINRTIIGLETGTETAKIGFSTENQSVSGTKRPLFSSVSKRLFVFSCHKMIIETDLHFN
jgi:hypothetical protein